MKILWIAGLLSLLMIAAYARVSNNPGGAWETLANKRTLPFAVAPPVASGGDDSTALTVADYVFLHETRGDGATVSIRRSGERKRK